MINYERPLVPPSEDIVGYCAMCGAELYPYDDARVYGKTVCDKCAEYAKSDDCVIDYIEAYYDKFIDFLRMGCGVDEIQKILEIYRDDVEGEIEEWLTR